MIENPYAKEHYLCRYFCIKPKVIHTDRRLYGDYYKKPTQYWFLNCDPENNLIFESVNDNSLNCKDAIKKMNKGHYEKMGAKNRKVARSMIHSDYANRFIREFIIKE